MIIKNFEINKLDFNLNKIFLLYGKNEGLKKETIKSIIKNKENLNFYEEKEIIENSSLFVESIISKSLFNNEKKIIIRRVTDKFLNIIKEIKEKNLDDVTIIINSENLDKKSKLRSFFEKSDICGISACYKDNEIAIRSIILKKLSNIKGVSTEIVNLIIRNTNLDRNKVNNEVDKIISCFQNSSVDFDKVNALLNQGTNDDFNLLKDEALNGNKNRTNQLLSDTVFSAENNIYYLNLINQRIQKLLIIENLKQSGQNTEAVISNLKPPVFWKDKPMILSQSRKWNKEKIQNALKKTLEIEIDLKTKNIRNKDVLIKNLIVELCVSANAS